MCWQDARAFLTHPRAAFKAKQKASLEEAFKYLLVMAIPLAILLGAVGSVASFSPAGFAALAVVSYIATVLFMVIGGLWLHLWAYVFGARKGLEKTLRSSWYAGTPSYVLGWIPVVNLAALAWELVLNGMGLQELQGMSAGRAAAAVIVALAVLLAVVVAFIAAIISTIGLGGLAGTFLPGTFSY
ncbi:MAG: YIP1 family protein [Candidatus Aenigmarchaeota archaeon]|nr:YIP1 family protein [Candidatus Aenigmarchaeota archaeon]